MIIWVYKCSICDECEKKQRKANEDKMNKNLVERVKVECEGVKGINKFELEYYLIKEEGIYGVEIIKRQGNTQEKKHLRDIVRGRENTVKIIEGLARNQVTPTTVEYVMDDYLGIYA